MSRRGTASPPVDEADASSTTSSVATPNYLSIPENTALNTSATFRGFSTSIHDMFVDPENERVDCCAMTCCGIFQSDRDRYLLTGITPPGPIKRFVVHIIIPLLIFIAAGYCALHLEEVKVNQLVSTGLVLLMVAYFTTQCWKGRVKRIDIRKDLLFTKYHIQQQQRDNVVLDLERPTDDADHAVYYMGQTRRDFRAAHPCCCCGCYPEDRLSAEHRAGVHRDDNMCSQLWYSLCPACCGMHVQCCGVCALAQEGREMEKLSYRKIDYVTMQPIMEYYPSIYEKRWDLQSSSRQGNRLSRLSIRLLQSLVVSFILLAIWCVVAPYYLNYMAGRHVRRHTFSWSDLLVFGLTILQAVALLGVLAFFINRPKPAELSADAIIKFFAAGFFLSTSLAVFWEVVIGISLRILESLLLLVTGTDIAEDPDGYQQAILSTGTSGFGQLHTIFWRTAGAKNYIESFGEDHPLVYTLLIAVNAFFIAALIEELCKYFGYRMVEHPDFMTRQELEEVVVDQESPIHRPEDDFANQRVSKQAHGAAITLAMVSVAMGFTCCENLVYIFIYSGGSVRMEAAVLIARAFFPVHPISAAMQSVGVCQRDVEKDRTMRLGRIIFPAVLFHGSYDFFILWIDFLLPDAGVVSFLVSVIIMAIALCYTFGSGAKQRERLIVMDQQSNTVGPYNLL